MTWLKRVKMWSLSHDVETFGKIGDGGADGGVFMSRVLNIIIVVDVAIL